MPRCKPDTSCVPLTCGLLQFCLMRVCLLLLTILLLLVMLSPQRQIHAYALSDLRQNLADSTGGFSSWNGVKTCERKCWVHRDA